MDKKAVQDNYFPNQLHNPLVCSEQHHLGGESIRAAVPIGLASGEKTRQKNCKMGWAR